MSHASKACSSPFGAGLAAVRRLSAAPGLAASLPGLASTVASTPLPAIFHPFEPTVSDLLIHSLAVAIVVVANAALGNRLLSRWRPGTLSLDALIGFAWRRWRAPERCLHRRSRDDLRDGPAALDRPFAELKAALAEAVHDHSEH